ncbi:ATP-binding protein [Cereibacter azotoformans]|uniref:ATP-binding protein n=1 Tax=Cereibacter azotoformans TaxID=43057 RepID=UPI000C6D65E4|nr:ATP-binding protein [Cereibacter azotoformans]
MTARPPSLARWHGTRLALAFLVYELVLAGLFVAFMAYPMARRAADDLAGLMVLAAQTWAELPPATRPALAAELRQSHGIRLAPPIDYRPAERMHPPFIHLLEAALGRRSGGTVHLHAERIDGETWYWVNLPAGGQQLACGIPQSRYNSRPLVTLGLGLAAGMGLALVLSAWLARRLARPIRGIDRATEEFARRGTADPLPETGPREIAALGRHFNEMTRQIRELLVARTMLLAGISHDLRTPLARMRLSLELAREGTPGQLDRIERDVERMNVLIGQTLDLARGLRREPEEVIDLLPFLEDVAAPHPRVRVEAAGPAKARVAPLALQRALGNLLENAARHAPDGPIDLRAETSPAGLRISVLDRGPGIPEDRIDRMTEPFQRLEPSRSPATGGSGLGLAIVRELARANGWRLTLGNRQGGGLEVWLELDRADG